MVSQPCSEVCGGSAQVEHIHLEQCVYLCATYVKTVLNLKTQGYSGNFLVKAEIALCPLFNDTQQFQAGYEVLLGSPWVEKVLGKGIICVLFQTR